MSAVMSQASLTSLLSTALLIAAGMALLVSEPALAQQKRLYRWVDEQGRVHYSDQLPPTEVQRAREEYSERGTKLRSVERALTPEEREAMRLAALAAEEERKRREAEEAEKRKLLQMYPSEEQLVRAHQDQLRLLDRQLNTARVVLESEETVLAQLLAQAAEADGSGKPVPPVLTGRIKEMRERVANSRAEVDRLEREKQSTREQQQSELERYRSVRAELEERMRRR